MKRIYMTMALLGGLAIGAKAQNIDFLSDAAIDTTLSLVPHTTLDTNEAIFLWGVGESDGLVTGDKVAWQWSFNEAGEMWVNTISQDVPDQNTALFVAPNSAMGPGHSHAAPFELAIDSIGILLDWNQFANNDTLVYLAPPFTNCKEYGLFIDVFGLYDEASNSIIGNDPDGSNNLTVLKVKWNCGTSVKDILVPKDRESLAIYPNPATTSFTFKYDFKEYSTTSIRVVDMTGRTVMSKKLGRFAPGTKELSLDVSTLPAGNYSVVLETETKIATSKLTIRK